MMMHHTDAYDTPEITSHGEHPRWAGKMPGSDHTFSPAGAALSHVPLPVLPSTCPGQGTLGMRPQNRPLDSCLELAALPGAVPCARLHAKHVAWEWGFYGLVETIELLVSELITNAVQAVASLPQPAFVRLWLTSDRVRVLVEVWDANPRFPVPKTLTDDGVPALDEEGGRGLLLVATLSRRWGWYPARRWGGKVVWCELIALSVARNQDNRHAERRSAPVSLAGPVPSSGYQERNRPWS